MGLILFLLIRLNQSLLCSKPVFLFMASQCSNKNFYPKASVLPQHRHKYQPPYSLQELKHYHPGITTMESTQAVIANVIQKAKPPKPNLTTAENTTLTELINKESIAISKADKGRCGSSRLKRVKNRGPSSIVTSYLNNNGCHSATVYILMLIHQFFIHGSQ